MRLGGALVGILVVMLSLLAPQELVGLALKVLGLSWLDMPALGVLNPAKWLANLVAGSGFAFGLKRIWSALRGS